MIPAVVVLAGGEPPPLAVLEEIPEGSYVVAADSGLDHARALGLDVHICVGDFDSVSEEALAAYEHVPLQRHPADKDATDLELALALVADLDTLRVIVVGGHGGRLDHLLANASLVASPLWNHLDVEWLAGSDRAHVVRTTVELHGSPGDVVTLLPVGGQASGVTTEGLRWPLHDEDLPFGTSRGVSNELVRAVARVRVRGGTLLAIQPGAIG